MSTGRQKEHEWLDRFIGDWTFEITATSDMGKPAETHRGRETVRSLGGVWVVCDGTADMPGGGSMSSVLSLGYDPAKKRYKGTFIASMMPDLWIYEGELDGPSGNRLVLNTEGPSVDGEGKRAPYRDVIEFAGDDQRTMTSSYRDEKGTWHQFMTGTYRRTP